MTKKSDGETTASQDQKVAQVPTQSEAKKSAAANRIDYDDLLRFAGEVGDHELQTLIEECRQKSFDEGKTAIPFQAVAKFLYLHLRKKFSDFVKAKGEIAGWNDNDYMSMSIRKITEEDALRPKGERMYEESLKFRAVRVAIAVYRDASNSKPIPSKHSDSLAGSKERTLFDADQMKRIDAYLKRIQDERKRTRDSALAGTVRTLSAEELAKYQSVALTTEQARVFNKEKDSKAMRKKI